MSSLYKEFYPRVFYLFNQCVRFNLSIKTILQSDIICDYLWSKKRKFHFVCSILLKNNHSKFLQPYLQIQTYSNVYNFFLIWIHWWPEHIMKIYKENKTYTLLVLCSTSNHLKLKVNVAHAVWPGLLVSTITVSRM